MQARVRQGWRLVFLADGDPKLESARVSDARAEDNDRLVARRQNPLHRDGHSQLVFGWRHPGLAHKRSRRRRRHGRPAESVQVPLPPWRPSGYKNGPSDSRVSDDPAAQPNPPAGDPVHQPAAFVSFSSRSTIDESVANAASTRAPDAQATPPIPRPSSGG